MTFFQTDVFSLSIHISHSLSPKMIYKKTKTSITFWTFCSTAQSVFIHPHNAHNTSRFGDQGWGYHCTRYAAGTLPEMTLKAPQSEAVGSIKQTGSCWYVMLTPGTCHNWISPNNADMLAMTLLTRCAGQTELLIFWWETNKQITKFKMIQSG